MSREDRLNGSVTLHDILVFALKDSSVSYQSDIWSSVVDFRDYNLYTQHVIG